jgi:hypothetical protein
VAGATDINDLRTTASGNPPETADPAQRDALYLALLTAFVSIIATITYFRHDALLLSGDAVAHINIARRVFDSRNPGPLQLGTVWLPLPHLLIIPFVISRWMWRTGVGGAIPSMISYVVGTLGIFRLLRDALAGEGARTTALESGGWTTRLTPARLSAWLAAIIYAANPNLIYLQATALTEPLYLALFIWATVFFAEFVRICARPKTGADFAPVAEPAGRALQRCGVLLALAILTRYDGWFAGAVFVGAAFVVMWAWTGRRIKLWRSPLRPAFTRFLLIIAAGPLLWFVYNTAGWGNPLEFATGPYSARAIEQRSAANSQFHHPGWKNPRVALVYFVKDARLNLASGLEREYGNESRLRAQNLWIPLALAGTVLLLIFARGLWSWLLLWTPLLFYVLSIAWGGVPIFVPAWWPFSYYNVRYGLQLLPAIAVLSAAALYVIMTLLPSRATNASIFRSRHGGAPSPALRLILAALLLGFTAISYASIWRAGPICLMEARANSATRIPYERRLAAELKQLPPHATVLMYLAANSGVLQRADIPLRSTINETLRKTWKAALLRPTLADYAVATEGDPVALAIRDHGDSFDPLVTIEMPGEPRTVIYRKR